MFLRSRSLNRGIFVSLALVFLAVGPALAQSAPTVLPLQFLEPHPTPGTTVADTQPLIQMSTTWQTNPDDIARSDQPFQPPRLTLVLDAHDISPDVKLELSPLDVFPPIFVATYQPPASLAEGTHLVEAKAVDTAGSVAKLAWRFIVASAPEEPILIERLYPEQNSFIANNRGPINAVVSAKAGIALDSIQLYLNYQPVKPEITPGDNQKSPEEAKIFYRPERPLIDGTHAVTLSVKDITGHVAKVEWHFTVDTMPPKVIPLFPRPDSRIPDTRPIIRAEVHEAISGGWIPRREYPIPGGSGIQRDSLRMYLDGKPVAAKLQMVPVADAPFESAQVEYRPEAPLANGPHKLALILKDRAGLKGVAEWAFHVEADSPPAENTNAITIGGIEYRLTLNKRNYLPGEPVQMAFRVTNMGQEEVSFTFPDGQLYDFLVTHQSHPIWQWSDGKLFPEVITVKKLAPGDQMAFREVWLSTTADGQLASPGEYQATGILTLTREPGPWMDLLRSLVSGAMPIAWPPRVNVKFLIQGEEPPPPAGETLAGRVLTQEDAPIPGAVAELWLENRLVERVKTDEEGYFLLERVRPVPHMLRVWRDGFFPERTEVDPRPKPLPEDATLPPEIELRVQLSAVPQVTPTPYVADFYGRRVGFEAFGRGFQPALPGDVIIAQDPDGTVCGVFMLHRPGEYGFLHAVGDDPVTNADEGAVDGDVLSFQINDEPAQPVPPEAAVWESGAAPKQVDLIVSGPQPVETVLHLRKGDNLVAFSHLIHTLVAAGKVDARQPQVPMLDLLGRWKGVQLARGFAPAAGFRTFDPSHMAFSDLHVATPFEGYWLQMAEDLEVTQSVIPLPADTPFSLETGWNLVSYLPLEPMPVQEALASIEGQYKLVRGFDNGTQLLAAGLEEFSDLEQMQPNGAYWIKMLEPATLVYPAGSTQPQPEPTAAPMAALDMSMPDLQVARSMYSNALYGSVTLDGQPAPSGTRITVFDSEGRIAGAGVLRRRGKYGFLHVYRDGAKAGPLTILVNGKLAMSGGKARWTALKDMLGDMKRLDLKARSRDIGDLNEDGQLNRQDVRLLLRKLVHGEKPTWADLTGDGKVTALDAAMLMRTLTSQANALPNTE